MIKRVWTAKFKTTVGYVGNYKNHRKTTILYKRQDNCKRQESENDDRKVNNKLESDIQTRKDNLECNEKDTTKILQTTATSTVITPTETKIIA